jgi:hypothetical protein
MDVFTVVVEVARHSGAWETNWQSTVMAIYFLVSNLHTIYLLPQQVSNADFLTFNRLG